MQFNIIKASQDTKPLKAALLGQSGAGKTLIACLLADCLEFLSKAKEQDTTTDTKTIVVDSEGGAVSIEAKKNNYNFDLVKYSQNFFGYAELKEVMQQLPPNYKTVIIDSLSPTWSGKSGLLQKATEQTKNGQLTLQHHKLITGKVREVMADFQDDPRHFIATLKIVDSVKVGKNSKDIIAIKKVDQKKDFEFSFDLIVTCYADGYIDPNGYCYTPEDIQELNIINNRGEPLTTSETIKQLNLKPTKNFIDLTKSRYVIPGIDNKVKFKINELHILQLISQVLNEPLRDEFFNILLDFYNQNTQPQDINTWLQNNEQGSNLSSYEIACLSWLFFSRRLPLSRS